MPAVRKVLVVGGGIGGLTAAAAIAQRGIACEVVEIAQEPIGAAIMIIERALHALDSIGALGPCAAEGNPNPFARRGEISRAVRRSQGNEPDSDVSAIGLYRPVLSRILRERAEALGARVRMGVGLRDLAQDEDGVDAIFSDGSTGRYDLLVGADGIRSLVRSLSFGEIVRPEYTGRCAVRWMTPGEPIPGLAGTYYAEWGRLLTYPLPRQKLIYAINNFPSEVHRHLDQDEVRALVLKQLDSFSEPQIRALRDRLTSAIPMIYRAYEWLMVPEPWYRGRVVLIGDAAHATTANMSSGGGMAIEDGVVLGAELERASTLPEALDAFMKRRLGRVRMVVETSIALAKMETEGASPAEVTARGAPAFEALAGAY
jgi:2-polyprenyl-6-methoxyphenol hydroxylase-like FAD-dependent oxidoreductase